MTLATAQDKAGDVFTLPELPFAKNALEPHMSAETFDYHHGKHHNAYVVKANELIQGTGLEDLPLEEIVRQAKAKGLGPLFNNVGQHFNHSFFWQCMKPQGGGEPTGALLEKSMPHSAALTNSRKTSSMAASASSAAAGSGWWKTAVNWKSSKRPMPKHR